ncbi:MAG: CARDB domain-containing protein [bacterium]
MCSLTRLLPSNLFIGQYYNPGTGQWVTVSSPVFDLPGEVLVGLASCSHVDDESILAVGKVRDVRVTEFSSCPSRPTWTYDFSGPDLVSDGVIVAPPTGYILGRFSSGEAVPADSSVYALSDGVGAMATVSKGQAATVYFPAQRVQPGGAIVRVSVWALAAGVQVGLAALDSDEAIGLNGVDGSIATRILANSDSLQEGWHQLALFIDSYKEGVVPVVQVVGDGETPQTVFLDNLEILTPCDLVQDPTVEHPDLEVMNLTLVPGTIWPDDVAQITAVVVNTGRALAEGISVRFSVDGVEIGSEAIARLEPGSEAAIAARWTATGSGDHIVRVQVDPSGSIPEDDKGDNSLGRIVSVEDSQRPLPDLFVGEVSVTSEGSTTAEMNTILRASIENAGDITANEAEVIFQLADGTQYSTFIGQVAPAGAEIAVITITIPVADIYPMVVTVDTEDRVEELDENNNRSTTFQPVEWVEDPVEAPDIPGPIRRMLLFMQEHGFEADGIPEDFWLRGVEHERQMRPPSLAEYDPGGTAPRGDFPASIHSDEGTALAVSAVGDPGAPSILGNVGQFVNVEAGGSFDSAALKIGLTPEEARDVDPITLRLFHYHRPSRSFQLVHPSGLGNDGTYVWGLINEPGIYAVFGLPRDQARLALLKALREIQPFSAIYKEITRSERPTIENEISRLSLSGDTEVSTVLQDPLQMNLLGFQDLVGNAQLLEGDIFGEIPRDEKGHPIGSRPVLDYPLPVAGIEIDTLPGTRRTGDYRVPDLSVSGDYLPEYQIIDHIESVIGKALGGLSPERGGNWQSVGPTNLAGRVKALAIHPKLSTALYAGVAEGGFFRLIGNTWYPTMHDEARLSVGAIALAPSNPKVIYVGTGEYWTTKIGPPATTYAGVGVYRSEDAGWNWELMPFNNKLSNRISRILVHPGNPDIVYVAGNRGIHRWSPISQTWKHIATTDTSDLIMHPTNPEKLYAGMEDSKGVQWSSDPSSSAPTWIPMNDGLTLPQNMPSFIKLAISPSHPDILYAHTNSETYDTASQRWTANNTRTYRFENGKWEFKVADVAKHSQDSWCSFIRVHPTDPDRIFVGGVRLAWSPDGGDTWHELGSGHADNHDLIFDPLDPNRTIIANDGGIWEHTQTQDETTWDYSDLNKGLVTIQFRNVSVSQKGPYTLGGSTQDQGILVTHQSTNFDGMGGNEGGIFEVDPSDGDIIYWDPWSGNLMRTENGLGSGKHEITDGIEKFDGETPSISALAVGPQESDLVICSAEGPGGTRPIYRSVDGGDSWQKVYADAGSAVTRIAFAPSDPFWVYAITSDGRVLRSTGEGTVWTQISNSTLPQGKLYGLAIDWYDKQRVYVAGREKSSGSIVWRSKDGGQNWEDISGPQYAPQLRLPNVLGMAIAVHKGKPNTLYVCTEVGVFRSQNGGMWWAPFDKGLPNAIATDMDYQPHTQTLYVSTIGRGMYKNDL